MKKILTTSAKIKKLVDNDTKVGDKILIVKDGILRKAESPKKKEFWTINCSYKQNNQGYTRNQIGTTKCPESRTLFLKFMKRVKI